MAQAPHVAHPTRPPRALNVVRAPEAKGFPLHVDWSSWYLTDEEDMGEGCEQGVILRLLFSALQELCRRRGLADAFVGTDNFFAWVPTEPLVRVSPDVYLLRGALPSPLPGVWETWRDGVKPPLVAFEIVSSDWKKDYRLNPEKYAQLGVQELYIFDPEAAERPLRGRVPLQAYRRAQDGAFVSVYEGAGPARSEVLDAWFAVVAEGPSFRLRPAEDPQALHLIPTADEARRDAEKARLEAVEARRAAEQAQRQAEQAQRQAEQAQRQAEQAREAERRAREAAERELEALRRRIAEVDQRGGPEGGAG